MPTQMIGSFSMHYEDLGKGPTVVLVHGFPLDGRVWMPVAKELGNDFRVIVPDLRGFGRSKDESSFTIESMADDVYALMRSLGISTYAVGGLSMGGYAAQAFAKKYPSVLSALILCDTKAAADNEQQKKGRNEMIELVRKEGTGSGEADDVDTSAGMGRSDASDGLPMGNAPGISAGRM